MAHALPAKKTETRTEEGEQQVTFYLNNEIYAVGALAVQEIIELANITKVPHLPHFFKGVINLRGAIIPVIDLKLKFEMSSGEYRKHTCVIITEFSGGVMGLIVDAVSDVLYIPSETVSAAPSFGVRINTDFIKGIARVDDNLVIIIDIDKVLSEADTIALVEAHARAVSGEESTVVDVAQDRQEKGNGE